MPAQTNNSSHLSLDSTPIYYRSQRNKACCISHHHYIPSLCMVRTPLSDMYSVTGNVDALKSLSCAFILSVTIEASFADLKVMECCRCGNWHTEVQNFQSFFSELTLRKIKSFSFLLTTLITISQNAVGDCNNNKVQCAFQTYFLSFYFLQVLAVGQFLQAHCS